MKSIKWLVNALNSGLVTDAELSRLAGVARSTLGNIRKGTAQNPTLETVEKITTAIRRVRRRKGSARKAGGAK